MADSQPPDLGEIMCNRTWAVALIIDNELWNWGRNNKRMDFTGARVRIDLGEAGFADLKEMFVKAAAVKMVDEAKGNPYMGWARPLAVRCVSGHSNGAELTTISITDKIKEAIGGAWRVTSRYNLF